MSNKIQIVKALKDSWSVVTKESPHTHILRTDLSKKHAEGLAFELNQLLNCKLTRETCKHCGGIGGCYDCDS